MTRVTKVSNGKEKAIEYSTPYRVKFTLEGTTDLVFPRWRFEDDWTRMAVKKTEDMSNYVQRNKAGFLCLPGEYVRQAIIHEARCSAYPRSLKKSAAKMKTAIISLTPLASLGVKEWDHEEQRTVKVLSNITLTLPAMKAGWTATFIFVVASPEYINPDILKDLLSRAGLNTGVGAFRPSYGRFKVTKFEVLKN